MENVVAAILVPASHQGSDRPDTKKSTNDPEARRDKYSPNHKVRTRYVNTISQSIQIMGRYREETPGYLLIRHGSRNSEVGIRKAEMNASQTFRYRALGYYGLSANCDRYLVLLTPKSVLCN